MKPQNVHELLKESIVNHTVSHAYIFEGPRGIGKKTEAMRFAAAIHCETGSGEACGVCHACRMHAAMTHPDFQIFREEKKASTGVEYIRDCVKELYLKPMIADKKVYLIPEADTMTPEAQSAFLKAFEEPPGDCVIIMVSESADKLLPTIHSRGRRILFPRKTEQEIRDFITSNYPDCSAELDFIARFSDGRVGMAKEICESASFLKNRLECEKHFLALAKSESSVFSFRDFLLEHKDELPLYLELLLGFFHDCIRIKLGGNHLINRDLKEELEDFSSHFTAKNLSMGADAILWTSTNIGKQSNAELWYLDMLLSCWRNLHGTGNRRSVS